MIYFLDRIATHLFEESGGRLDRHCLVFPNRRAGLYFLKYLALKAGKPVWSPQVKTINELFQSFSALKLAESELLVCELFKIYRQLNRKAGSIDDFFFWGEMLINDFDDVDKYLVNAADLFLNIKELKEIDRKFGELTNEQIEIIRQFWIDFNAGSPTDQKADFQEVWSILLPLYRQFSGALKSKGVGYEGMIYRELAEKCTAGSPPAFNWDYIHFIGFNALNNCEKVLMSSLKGMGKARFYWDYDESFVKDNPGHSAGFFIKDNLELFGNDMPADWSFKTSSKPHLKIIDCSSDTAQVKLASKLVGELDIADSNDAHHTAVVLADENLLMPALTSLPENADSINITMGYPLKFSPLYSLVRDLLELQKTARSGETGNIIFDRREVHNLINNSFLNSHTEISVSEILAEINSSRELWIDGKIFAGRPLLENIFRKIETAKEFSSWLKGILEKLYIVTGTDNEDAASAIGISIRNEFIYRVILAITRLEAILNDDAFISVSLPTYYRLLDRILRAASIPFYGEPLNGIQIMGILETRCLDFRNLFILSVNEGILPQSSASGSYIPYNLREVFCLPTIRHQDSIYAYYFYRLLQRAENVTLIYNSASDGLKTGEMSRFILQMKYGFSNPEFRSQRFEIRGQRHVPAEIKRESIHIDKLGGDFLKKDGKILSPSAVNTWITCRMKFYYRYVCGLAEPEKISREIDPSMFGEILHSVMEKIYAPFRKMVLEKDQMDSLANDNSNISLLIEESINEKLYGEKKRVLSGNDLIISNILRTYIKSIIKRDREYVPLVIEELEYRLSVPHELNIHNTSQTIRIGGVIDRLDMTSGRFRITDYKTGKTDMDIPSVESLFDEHGKYRNDSWFQLFMYCHVYAKVSGKEHIRPSIYPVRGMQGDDFTDSLTVKDLEGAPAVVDDFEQVKESFVSNLVIAIENIFNPDEPFRMTDNLNKCEFCPYARLCQR